jgi:hypothetical protein
MGINPHFKTQYLWRISIVALYMIISIGCSSSTSSNGDTPGSPDRVTMSLENALTDITIPANETTHLEVTLQMPEDLGLFESVEIDVGATMQHVTISDIGGGSLSDLISLMTLQETCEVSVRVGNDPTMVCDYGVDYGTWVISTTSLDDSDPDDIELDNPTMTVLNSGPVILCMEILTSVDVTFSLDQVEADVTEGDCPAPYDFSGRWAGTYTCTHSCDGETFGDTVDIMVYQVGNTAYYTDLMGHTFSGTVCGNLFRFTLDNAIGYTERGSMRIYDGNYLIKKSTWRDKSSPYCHGDCEDYMSKVSGD